MAGRIWCGYSCPQSLWTWVFMWAEQVTEGERHQRIKLDAAPWSPSKRYRVAGVRLALGERVITHGALEALNLCLQTVTSPGDLVAIEAPAQAAIADYLQHGGYDRHLRKLRIALQTQQEAMLASATRHFPAGTRRFRNCARLDHGHPC